MSNPSQPIVSDAEQSLHSLAERINAEHAACEASVRDSVWHALECGRLLVEVKSVTPHGTWLSWLADSFDGSERTARNYMQLAKGWPELEANRQCVADLGVADALRLIADQRSALGREHDALQVSDDLDREALKKLPYGLPELDPDYRYHCMGRGGSFIEVDPHPQPRYWYVAVTPGVIECDESSTVFTKRGIHEKALAMTVVHYGGEPVRPWKAEPALEGKPSYEARPGFFTKDCDGPPSDETQALLRESADRIFEMFGQMYPAGRALREAKQITGDR
ncbi:MAG: DUF3102 domain-containing protein, partial [Planctomycetes bacterium]|nr:DUF3102 domain-containing protein [Planctomycetota bacterium]